MYYKDIVPYTSVFIDANWKHFVKAAWCCFENQNDEKEEEVLKDIQFICSSNKGYILPCLSVRSGLQLFLEVKKFPRSSEVIMSAINIPDMVVLLHSYGLNIVSLDINIDNMTPRIDLIPSLITSKTRFMLLANIYGKGYDMSPFIEIAKKYNLLLVEDWAEGYSGPENLGHSDADLSLFSFGPIKNFTAFGGALLRIKNEDLYARIYNKYKTYPRQTHTDYFTRLFKYLLVSTMLNCPSIVKPGIFISYLLNINHQEKVIKLLRGFPIQMLKRVRQRPCLALLRTLASRLRSFNQQELHNINMKAEHALFHLPPQALPVGINAVHRNHWLFPVIVEDPGYVTQELSKRGIDAYQGATQLNFVPSDVTPYNSPTSKESTTNPSPDSFILEKSVSPDTSFGQSNSMKEATQPINDDANFQHIRKFTEFSQAEYLINHVIYLPINKTVPFTQIDRICQVLSEVLAQYHSIPHEACNSDETSKLNGFEDVNRHNNKASYSSSVPVPHKNGKKSEFKSCFKKDPITNDVNSKCGIFHESYDKTSVCDNKSYDNSCVMDAQNELCNFVSDTLVNGKLCKKCKM